MKGVIIVISVFIFSCNVDDTATKDMASDSADAHTLSQKQKEEISTEILSMGAITVRALNEADLEALAQDFWQSDSVMFIIDGNKIQGYSNIKGAMQSIPERRKKMDLNVENEQVIVLSDDVALHVVEFNQEVTLLNDSIVQGAGIWTSIYNKMNDDWKVVAVHESHLRE